MNLKKFEKIRRVSKNFETYRSSCKVITFDDNYSGKKIEKNRHQKKKRKKINASGREKEREKKWRMKSQRNVTKLLISRRDDFRSILTGVAR